MCVRRRAHPGCCCVKVTSENSEGRAGFPRSTYLEVHPWQRVATEHLDEAEALGHDKGRQEDQEHDAAFLALSLALLVTEPLRGLADDQASV